MKLTLSQLQTLVKTYVDASKQAGAWKATTDNVIGLLDKVGMTITLDGSFQDKLPELDGNELPLGKTIEEWFLDLPLPTDFDSNGTDALSPADLTAEAVSYSYTLGRKVIKATERFNNVERAALTSGDASNMISKIMERLTNAYSLYTYGQKKQLLGNMIDKAVAANNASANKNKGDLAQVIAEPTNTDTGEFFIKQVKMDVEAASFASENTSLSKTLIGAAPSLILYIKKGMIPSLEVDTLAGAFHAEKLALPCEIKVVDDFGSNANPDAYAMLIDPRGVKLHKSYHAIRDQENAAGDFINFFDHSENTGFISKYTFVKVYKKA